ncbi:MAG: AAA domain-containing protein [Endomicrobia bacterium]|nr:AAA domain-containing protein [Endomicrobiia bacterium]
MNQVLKKITDFHPAIKCTAINSQDYVTNNKDDLKYENFIIYNSAGLSLVKKDNVYLINDLKSLLDSENLDFRNSVLKIFIDKDYVEGNDNYNLEKFSWKTLLLPFATNPQQSRVINELGKSKLLCVQGPPGTGKSQTIANLICHLVANGITILVTSQKNKALEVVSEMLDKLKIKYLYMKLFKDDKESKKIIKETINELLSEILSYDLKELENKLQYLERSIDEMNWKISKLYEEFIKAKNFEAKEVEGLNIKIGEVYSRYEKLKEYDIFEENEFIPLSEQSATKDLFLKYITELEKIECEYNLLSKLAEGNIPKSTEEVEQFLKDLTELDSKFEEEIQSIPPEEVNIISITLPCFRFSTDQTFKQLVSEINDIKYKLQQYIFYLSLINKSESNLIGRIINIIWRKPKAFIIKERIRPQLNSKFGEWIIIEECTPENYREIFSKIDKVLSAINVFELRKQIEKLIEKLRLSVRTDIISCVNEHCRQLLRIPLDKGKIIVICPKCKKEFHFSPTEINDNMITFNQLKYQLFHSYMNKDYNRFKEVFEKTKYLLTLFTTFLSIMEIEQQAKNCVQTMKKIRIKCLSDKSQFRFFKENLQKIVDVGVLKGIISKADSESRSTESISEDIRRIDKQKNELIRQFIDIRVKYNLRKRLNDRSLRNDLSYLARMLQRSKKQFATFEELKQNFDFSKIISTIPCWIISIDDVARIFPLVEGLFDVVVVDESSQCAIPSAIPILYRAKKAVIVGDDKQLPNVEMQYIDDKFNQSLIKECKIDDLPRSRSFDCKINSLFDLCAVFADNHIFLNEHFRCYPEIIRFCNEKFYNGRLILARSSFGNCLGRILNLEIVDGAYDDENLHVNKKEAEALVRKLKMLFEDQKYRNFTFGIMSIFREQVEYIKDIVYTPGTEFYIDPQTRHNYRLIIETADGFQGDERDVILYSFRYASNSSPLILAHTRREEDYKRLNVAFSRARSQIFCFVSLPPQNFPRGILREFLEYVQNSKSLDIEYQPWDSEFEMEVQSEIEKLGLKVYPQFRTCGFIIDLVVTDGKNRVLAVECDGWRFHYNEYGVLREEDIERQRILERAGWKVIRITSRDFYRSRSKALKPIVEFFNR